ncbi:hypothetical protein SISSUDRAFT_1008346 [Sistotremastrum suecicum HHB10207 ss-3]|uniref:SMAD/FHA domain-containing protein n=1 Tax=Sistotremastrum suecicum HHB10207 ss-3 TaxID=1314776 RepID=A0A166AWD0_9AGAM|nr:hypothetical protein SISSUDRAFT_1008346 [Sistotremastrum suecicum HHB10207 ss-3]
MDPNGETRQSVLSILGRVGRGARPSDPGGGAHFLSAPNTGDGNRGAMSDNEGTRLGSSTNHPLPPTPNEFGQMPQSAGAGVASLGHRRRTATSNNPLPPPPPPSASNNTASGGFGGILRRRRSTTDTPGVPPAHLIAVGLPPQLAASTQTPSRRSATQAAAQPPSNPAPEPSRPQGSFTRTTSTPNNPSATQTQRIRLVPHLDSNRSLHFEAFTRDVKPGDSALRIGRFTDRSNQGINHNAGNKLAFKSKVVSRGHAEVWLSEGKFWIKDTSSSSGTFLNHVRLSAPGTESAPHVLKDGDVLQLGVDFQGGTEDIYKCVKIRIEIGREWQRSNNAFNSEAKKLLQGLGVTGPIIEGKGKSADKKNIVASGQPDCCICLFPVSICQAIFLAPCSHAFHYKCIKPLLDMHHPGFSCPLCRTFANLDEDVEVETEPVPSSGDGEDMAADDEGVEEPPLTRHSNSLEQERDHEPDPMGMDRSDEGAIMIDDDVEMLNQSQSHGRPSHINTHANPRGPQAHDMIVDLTATSPPAAYPPTTASTPMHSAHARTFDIGDITDAEPPLPPIPFSAPATLPVGSGHGGHPGEVTAIMGDDDEVERMYVDASLHHDVDVQLVGSRSRRPSGSGEGYGADVIVVGDIEDEDDEEYERPSGFGGRSSMHNRSTHSLNTPAHHGQQSTPHGQPQASPYHSNTRSLSRPHSRQASHSQNHSPRMGGSSTLGATRSVPMNISPSHGSSSSQGQGHHGRSRSVDPSGSGGINESESTPLNNFFNTFLHGRRSRSGVQSGDEGPGGMSGNSAGGGDDSGDGSAEGNGGRAGVGAKRKR